MDLAKSALLHEMGWLVYLVQQTQLLAQHLQEKVAFVKLVVHHWSKICVDHQSQTPPLD
jgi:hypothetical protein